MTDLKLIDELLCEIRSRNNLSWAELESWSNLTREAMNRIRVAYYSKERPAITLGLSKYFESPT